ncbi:uncharacterized protein LOC116296955 isoform X2 [Actinia tenebrosa]|uniref:Uncharacterized protein LOC116296955 isoform X2 n=1 Tax=Actinia tenebrosa TaxID=6105 RepID=A0A6P8I7A8_ACTTE|nr:uncharacterized protein LOC116296955 isoform X2 [Actinia tenebrosa]
MPNSLLFLTILCVFTFVAARPRIYRQVGSSPCPVKEQLNSPGTITSPGHPGPYAKNSTCTWIIAAPRDAVVWLEFLSFDIKSGPSCGAPRCKCDYLQIREIKKTLPKFVKKFCEGHLPKGVIRTSSSRVRVQFGSDITDEGTGFSLKFWFTLPTTSPPVVQNATTIPSLVVSEVPKQATKARNVTSSNEVTSTNVVPVVATQEPTKQTTKTSAPLIVDEPTKPVSTPPKQIFPGTPTTEGSYGFTPVPSEKYSSVSRPIKARSTPLKDGPPPAPRGNYDGGNTRSNVTVPVVLFLENKKEAKKAEEEEDPPDAIVLGPSIPIILIFIGVVMAIAWWKFRGDQKERLRYEEISKRKRIFKKKQNMREIRTKRLYSDMTRSWQGRSQTAPSPISGRPRRTFAGRLLELAEKPVSYMKTPRSSRPSSMVIQEQATPLVVMRQKKDRPENASHLDPGNRPPSRPASMLLRDALNMIFGATPAEPSTDSTSETPKESGSGNTSQRASKRVSFYDALAEKMAEVKEAEDEAGAKTDEKSKLAPHSIPHIMIRQPSYDSGDDLEIHRRSPSPKSSSISEEKDESSSGPAVDKEIASHDQTVKEPSKKIDQQDAAPGNNRPRSFDKKLVEKLEDLQREGDERERDCKERDELEEPSTPPVPHQTPDPRDSASASPTGKVMNCNELEDFLLNLDREMKAKEEDQQP